VPVEVILMSDLNFKIVISVSATILIRFINQISVDRRSEPIYVEETFCLE
jgi:hypothetical protein